MRRLRVIGGATALTLSQILFIAALLVLWEYLARAGKIDVFFFSQPTAIGTFLKDWSSGHGIVQTTTGVSLWGDLAASALVFAAGYIGGIAFGIVLGLIMGVSRAVREVLEPFVTIANVMPKLLILPVLLVIFGFGYLAQILLVFVTIGAFVAISISSAVEETPQILLENARVLGASRIALMSQVYLPSISIWVLSTARTTVGYALQATIAAEFIGASKGLGFRVVDGGAEFRPDEMFAAFAVITVVAVVADALVYLAERRVTRWQFA